MKMVVLTLGVIASDLLFDGGTAQYNYNFSFDQFSILLDASFPLNQLPTSFTLNKTFRIVIVPGDDGVNTEVQILKLLVIKWIIQG
jgi:hypothetical protein